MEQIEYSLLFRWFVGLGMGRRDVGPDHLTKNRDWLLDGDIAQAFLRRDPDHAETARLLSDEHFTVDGTWLEAWASHQSFRPRDQDPTSGGGGNPTVNLYGQCRTNATHQSTTDPDARRYKKAQGREARLGYLGRALLEHRSGLIVRTTVTPADGRGERDATLTMLDGRPGRHRISLAADEAHATGDLVTGLRAMTVTPQHRPAHDGPAQRDRRATTQHPGYAISQRKRRLVEQGFGWMKTIGLAQPAASRRAARHLIFTLTAAAYNLVRLRRLLPASAWSAGTLAPSGRHRRPWPRRATDERREPHDRRHYFSIAAAC